jgi:hypothetical protein
LNFDFLLFLAFVENQNPEITGIWRYTPSTASWMFLSVHPAAGKKIRVREMLHPGPRKTAVKAHEIKGIQHRFSQFSSAKTSV